MQFLKSSTQEEKEITALNKYKLFVFRSVEQPKITRNIQA